MKFTLAHGYALSLGLHAALLLPFVVTRAEPPTHPSLLVVELQGTVGDTQSPEERQREAQGTPERPQLQSQPPLVQKAPEFATPPPPRQSEATNDGAVAPPSPKQFAPEEAAPRAAEADPPTLDESKSADKQEAKAGAVEPSQTPKQLARELNAPGATQPESQRADMQQATEPQPEAAPVASPPPGSSGRENIKGEDDPHESRTLAEAPNDAARLKAYSAGLIKKVQRNLAYPEAGRRTGIHGVARVAFALEANGGIRPGSLRIVEGTGQPALDASALRTLRNSEPFDPPPHPMTVVIAVAYGPRK